MTKSENDSYEDLRGDGQIVIYKRDDFSNYYVRLKVFDQNSNYKFRVRSLKTKDRNQAITAAFKTHEEITFHLKSGGSLDGRTYRNVFDEWKQSKHNSYTDQVKVDRTVEYAGSYSLDYFGSMIFDRITTQNFHQYWDWRKVNYKRRKPSHDTLNRERTAIMSIFKFGYQRGYIRELFEIPKLKTKGITRRPTFTLAEWKKITKGMRSWVPEGIDKGHWRERFLLQQYVLLMSNSGVRVGEMRNLKWDDVSSITSEKGKHYVLRVSGKTGERDVVLNPYSDTYLKRIYDLRTSELGHPPDPTEYVFISSKTGGPYTSFKTSFNNMLKYCGVPVEKGGMNRTIYSLRHFYGTQRLKGNINPYVLSKQMGTSVEMIEKFYGHIMTRDVMDAIKQSTNQRHGDEVKKIFYPFD
ncbi:site-specific integrase [Paracoccaceae bacterium]|nr:site-specific integrase [Paracoccaceae bacterium]